MLQCTEHLDLPPISSKSYVKLSENIVLLILAVFWDSTETFYKHIRKQIENLSHNVTEDIEDLFALQLIDQLKGKLSAIPWIRTNIARLGIEFVKKFGIKNPALVVELHRCYILGSITEKRYRTFLFHLKENRIPGDPYAWIHCVYDILEKSNNRSLLFDDTIGIFDYVKELSTIEGNAAQNLFTSKLPKDIIAHFTQYAHSKIIHDELIKKCKTPFLVHYLESIEKHSKFDDVIRIFQENSSYIGSWKDLNALYSATVCSICQNKCEICENFATKIISYIWPNKARIGVVLRALKESDQMCAFLETRKSCGEAIETQIKKELLNYRSLVCVRDEINEAVEDYWHAPKLLQLILDKIATTILPDNSELNVVTLYNIITYFGKHGGVKNIVDLIIVSKAMKLLVDNFNALEIFKSMPCDIIVTNAKSVEKLKLVPSTEQYINFITENYKRLQKALKQISDGLSEYSYTTLQILYEKKDNLFTLMQLCEIDITPPIEETIQKVERLYSEYCKRKILANWLKEHNCNDVEFLNINDDNDDLFYLSLEQLNIAIDDFDAQDVFDNIDINHLIILSEQNSIVFVIKLAELANEPGNEHKILQAYENTVDFYKKIILRLGDADFKSVLFHRDILSAIHLNMKNETQIIREILAGDNTDNLAANITDTLEKITECVEIDNILKSSTEISFCDRDSIKRAKNLFTDNYSMVQALEEVKKVICSLTSSELRYFPQLHKHQEILELEYFEWGEEQFVQRCNIARNNLGSSAHRYALAVLQNLETARKILSPIIKYRDQPPRDLSEICKDLKVVLREDDSLTIDAKLESFKYVSEKKIDLVMWFDHSGGGLAGFSKFLTSYAKSGQFVSRLPLHPQGVDLAFIYDVDGEKQTYLNLEENIRAARVFNQTGESNSMRELFDLASDIHNMRIELETTGHPSFQGTEVCLNEIGKLSKEHYESLKKELKTEKGTWLKVLSETAEACPNLLFLNSFQLSGFISKFSEYLKKPNESFSLIHPYLWFCFPFDNYDPKSFSYPVLKWTQEKKNIDTSTPVLVLKLIGELVNSLNLLVNKQPNDSVENRLRIIILQNIDHQKSRKTFTDVNSVILKDIGSVPHPSQYFYCDSSRASIVNLERFLECSRKFSGIPYYLIKVESLTLELREHLIDWLTKLIASSEMACTNLTLIFYDISGAERYSFIEQVAVQNQTSEECKKLLSSKMKTNNPKGVSISCYCSPSETGKSFEIKKQLSKFNKNQIISLNIWEDFTPKLFLQELSSKKNVEELAIYLDISAFANFVEISKFLELLICWGLVCDGNTGEIVYCGEIKKHLFIELHTAPESDYDKYKFATSMDNILLELFCIPILSNVYKKEVNCSIEITNDLKNISVWFHLFSKNKNTGLKKVIVNFNSFLRSKNKIKCTPVFVNEQYKALRNYVNKEFELQLPLKKRFQNVFIKIFAARIDWLQRNVIDIFISHPDRKLYVESTLIDSLFKALLIESASIATENLAEMDQIMKDKPFATVLRFESTDFPIIEYAVLADGEICAKYPKPSGINPATDFESIIAMGLGITHKSKVEEIIKLRKYVFTKDFVFKLLFIHDRMKARENVLFEGDTGVGKTELLSIYSYLVNFTSNFDGCHSLREIITKKIHVMEGLAETTEKTQLYTYTKPEILQEIDRLLKPEGNFNVVVPALLREISQVLQSYPLVDIRSKVRLSKAITCINDGGDWNAVVENNDHVKEIIESICEFEYISLFYQIRMHDAYSTIDLHNDVTKIISIATEISEKTNEKATVVVFVDELNTTSIMGPMQSIFCDRMYHGKPLPDNIFWVCAINPHLKQNKLLVAIQNKITNFTGVEKQLLDYVVRPIPDSLNSLSITFAGQSMEQERQFVHSLLKERHPEKNSTINDRCSVLTLTILESQQFIKKLHVLKITVSIRDILRTVKIYEFLMDHPFLLDINEYTNENEIHWKALILTLGMSYMYRLQTQDDRDEYVTAIHKVMTKVFEENRHYKKRENFIPGNLSGKDKFKSTIIEVQSYLFNHSNIPDSIGKTEVFCENFFSVVVCCCAVVPLIIIGPPGCSKTLSFSVAIDNLSCKSDQKEIFKKLPKLEPFRYQCTPQSTDREIIERYKSAKERQNQFSEKLNSKDNDSSSKLCVVFLDEAGLSKEIPMKAIHYELDHPVVSTVILTNNLMDAAIMNRALQVFQKSSMARNDLEKLTKGTLCFRFNQLAQAFVNSYLTTLKNTQYRDSSRKDHSLFQLRDYILFLRFLREHEGSTITSSILLYALERNFNGVDKVVFRDIVQLWFANVNDNTFNLEFPMPKESDYKSTVELIRDNLNYRLLPNKDPNTAAYRFILVIDPTDNETAVSLLYSTKLCRPERENIKILEEDGKIPTDIFEVNEYSDTFEVIEVEAVKAFKSQGRIRELCFAEGTKIRVRNSNVHLDGWWEGEIDGTFGLFPSNHTVITKYHGTLPIIENIQQKCREFYEKVKDGNVYPPSSVSTEIVEENCKKYYKANETIQISIGDFSKDKSLDTISEAVHKVVYAMQEGKTVILINSSIIDGCFYDLFNRYFKVIQSATGRDCFANVAIGTHSRETIVHPDFKVIVHVPKSKLNSIALPYINRFEMYQLSVCDILEDKMKLPQWKSYTIDYNTATRNIIELVYDGCIDFIREVQASSQDKLLFGIAPEETLASILLDVINNTDKNSRFPNVKRPFIASSFNENMKNSAFQLYENNGTIHGRIKNIIRNINFRILQLARPEYLYNTDILKHQPFYVHEYFMKQEHFSVLRLMRSVIKYHITKKSPVIKDDNIALEKSADAQVENQVLTPKKWCIFTRSCGELLHLQKSFLSFITENIIPQESIAANGFPVEQFALEDLASISDIKDKVVKILSQEKTKILLVTIDMEECTSFQVNNLRQNIDIYIKEDQLVFTILHFPPLSMLTSKSGYHAIFINDWEFCYIDGIGVLNESNNNPNQNDQIDLIEEIDGRAWIARAFGLKIDYPEPGIFKNLFFEELSSIVNTMKCEAKNPTQCEAYNTEGRTQNIIKLFTAGEGSFMVDYILNIFKDSWTKNFLEMVVNNACKEVTKANIIGSLISSVRNKLLTLLRSLLVDFIKIFYAEHQLVHFYDMKDNYQDIYKYALTLLPNRDVDAILSNYTKKSGVENILCVETPTISRVPMFHSLNKFLLKHLDSIDQQRESFPMIVYVTYYNHLIKNEGLMKLLDIVEKNFLDDFLIDLVDNNFSDLRTLNNDEQLHLQQTREMIKDLLISISKSLLGAIGGTPKKLILAVYVCLRTVPHAIIYYKNFFMPLFQPFSTQKINKFTIIDNAIEINWEAKNSFDYACDLEFAALKCTINGYWDLFTKLSNPNGEPLQNNLILSWCKSFRVLHYRTENSQNNFSKFFIANRKEDVRLLSFRYKIFFVIFSCIRDLGIDPELIFEHIRKNSTIYNGLIFIDSPDKLTFPSELYSCLLILEKILSNDQIKMDDNIPRKYARILSSICNAIFRGRDRNMEMKRLENSLETIISLANHSIKGIPKIRDIWYENMTFDWTLQFINYWIHPTLYGNNNCATDIFRHLADTILSELENSVEYNFSYSQDNKTGNQIIDVNEQLYYFLQTEQYKLYSVNNLCNLYHHNIKKKLKYRENAVTFSIKMCSIVTCILQNTTLDSIKKLENRNKIVLQEILKEGACKYAPKSVVLHFLQQFSATDVLHILCDKKYYKDILNLDDKWGQLQPLEDINENYFPFMYDNTTNVGRQYQTLKDLIKAQPSNINAIIAYISNNSQGKKKYSIRCFLILIAYYEYFNFNEKANVIEQLVGNKQVQKCLFFNEKEMNAYRFVCNPNPNQSFDMFKPREFDANTRKQKHDLNDANFHINILATTLGSIPTRCHFYSIIFRLPMLKGKKMIGSTLNHEFYECGFKLGVGGKLQSCPAIMNDDIRYRYLLNSFVWTPVTLHALLFPDTFAVNCKALNWIDENSINRTENYQAYSSEFLRLFEEHETGIQLKQNGKIFAVNTLNIYVQDQWKENLDSALVDIFRDTTSAITYEQYLLRIFKQIEREYNNIKKPYQPSIAKNSPIIKHIFSVQDAQSNICVNPLPTMQQYKNFRSNLQLALEVNKREDNKQPFIDILLFHAEILDLLQLFPFFICCYQIFTNALWKKISRNDFNKPFLQVIQQLTFDKEMITEKHYEELCKSYEAFTVEFNKLCTHLDKLNFENKKIDVPKIDKQTTISTILSVTKEKNQSSNVIMRVLSILCSHQNTILNSIQDRPLAKSGLYFDTENTPYSNEIISFLHQQSSKLSVTSTNQNITQWIEQVCLNHRFIDKQQNDQIYSMINRNEISFDFERIEQECMQFISGASFLTVDNFQQIILPIEDITEITQINDEITAAIGININASDEIFARLELLDDPVVKLYWLINCNEEILKSLSPMFSEKIDKYKKRLKTKRYVKNYTENEIIALCKALTELILIIISQYKNNQKKREQTSKKILHKSFADLNIIYPKSFKSNLCNVPTSSLIPYCNYILQEFYYKKQWLFQNANMTHEFTKKQSKFYANLEEKFIDFKFSTDRLPIIEDILEKLTPNNSNEWLNSLENQDHESLLKALHGCDDLLNKHAENYSNLIQLIVIESLKVSQIQVFRQWLFALCGNITVRNLAHSPKKQENFENNSNDGIMNPCDYYNEKLPCRIDGKSYQNQFSTSEILKKENEPQRKIGGLSDDYDRPFPYDFYINYQIFVPINGISNEKNNCWLSSVLQCFSNNKLMVDKCKFIVKKLENTNLFFNQFYNILTDLQNNIDESPSKTIRIIDLYTDIIFTYNQFVKDQGKQKDTLPLEISKQLDVIEFQQTIFPTVLRSKLKSTTFTFFSTLCLNRSLTIDYFYKPSETEQIIILPMVVEKACSLEDLLQNFSSGEYSDEIVSRRIRIDNNRDYEFTIPISFERTADNILIDLPLNFPIDVSSLFCTDSKEHEIEAQGIVNSVVHHQTATGHYFATICKTNSNNYREWFRADDGYVKHVDPKEIDTSEIILAYLTITPKLMCKTTWLPTGQLYICSPKE